MIWALDFDGVLCDSVVETCTTGFRAAVRLWPGAFNEFADSDLSLLFMPDWLDTSMRSVRPVLETGYETMLFARRLVEGRRDAAEGNLNNASAQLVANWSRNERDLAIAAYGTTKEALIKAFGDERDLWRSRNEHEWLHTNRFFPDVVDALNTLLSSPRNGRPVIITTKQKRFAAALLRNAGVAIPLEDIYGLDSGRSKIEILTELSTHDKHITFVEDRVAMLYETQDIAHLSHVTLWLANWGYNTPEQRDQFAQEGKRCALVSLESFVSALKQPSFSP